MTTFAQRAVIFAAIVGLCPTAQAFRSTDVDSHTDPDYQAYRPTNVVLLVVAENTELRREIEQRITGELEDHGLTVRRQVDLFPPTRQWSEADQLAIYEREKIDSGIIVTAGASSASIIPFATQTHSTANVFGNYNGSTGNFNAHGNSTTTSQQLYLARSSADFSAVLLDLRANRVAWYADVHTKASGTAFVGTKGDAKGAVKGVVDGLVEDGHVSN